MNEAQVSKGQRRREQIMQLLKQQGRLSIQEMVDQLGCSEATARRDLEVLEKTEPLIRTIGGALYRGMHDLAFAEKTGILYLEKERIAAKAADLIHEGDVIGLSGGTTNYLLAKILKTRRGMTVVTNAINIAMELAGSDIQVVVTGGIMRHNSFELCGPLGEGMVSHLNIGKMFIGADGITADSGITVYSEQEAQIAKALIQRSRSTYALFDHTKVGHTSLFSIALPDQLYGLITDRKLPLELAAAFAQCNLEIHVAEGE
ncbi:DeoR/GlpR family DNA-binding transcription regulator [Paenibacillus sp. GCM10012307]|uniref:DeoR/GlpR transcriptional regulator n=1 Tax=Paenibacillus roseus TaxID=2798579 RepID=A0A934J7W2_9BACL|nr:DeoR/GlpR family DNA-binding transcription regulator [Paenibacillus roseus]MBJ6362032.1 DeoR/GlpR transcriptional regulator [Paenibacillus roseus]